jgi:hypothetical protein
MSIRDPQKPSLVENEHNPDALHHDRGLVELVKDHFDSANLINQEVADLLIDFVVSERKVAHNQLEEVEKLLSHDKVSSVEVEAVYQKLQERCSREDIFAN